MPLNNPVQVVLNSEQFIDNFVFYLINFLLLILYYLLK